MIYLPATLTPVPYFQGYFWDVEKHKLFSLKQGGELREMKPRRLWNGVSSKFGYRGGEWCYSVSKNGRRRTIFVEDLKRLTLVHYDIPVVELTEELA